MPIDSALLDYNTGVGIVTQDFTFALESYGGLVSMLLMAGYSPKNQEEGYFLMLRTWGAQYNDEGEELDTDSGNPHFDAEYLMIESNYDTYATAASGQQDYWSLQCHSIDGSSWSGPCHLVQGQWEAGTIEDTDDEIVAEFKDTDDAKYANAWKLAC